MYMNALVYTVFMLVRCAIDGPCMLLTSTVCFCRRVSSSSKAVSKPKSFLEIQQEQESDVHKQAVVSTMGASLGVKAPQRPKAQVLAS